MNKQLNYYGSTVDNVIVPSILQEVVETYIGTLIDTLSYGAGVVSALSVHELNAIPAKLYSSGNSMYISGGASLIFGTTPKIVVKIPEDSVIFDLSAIADNVWYNVYAKHRKVKGGVLKVIAKDFVYMYDNVNKQYSSEYDEIYYSVTTSTDAEGILIGKVRRDVSGSITTSSYIYKTGAYAFDIAARDEVLSGITPKFLDRYMELNKLGKDLTSLTDSAGIRIRTNGESFAEMLLDYDSGAFRWKSNLPISGVAPVRDADLTTKAWVTDYVSDFTATVQKPLNCRIDSIKSYTDISSIDSTMVGSMNRPIGNVSTGNAYVLFKWGYSEILGYGEAATNYFYMETGGPTSPADSSLTGYFIYLPNTQENLKIVGNIGSKLLLENEDGTAWSAGAGFQLTGTNYAILNCGADRYEVYAIPYRDGNPMREHTVSKPVTYGESPVLQQALLALNSGTKYQYKIAAFKNNKMSEIVVLNPTPSVLQFTNISNTGASVSVSSTANGFVVGILGWAEAEAFQIVYTADPAGASFTNSANESITTSSRTVNISCNRSTNYFIKVRPLIANQQVVSDADLLSVYGDARGVSTVTGSGGVLPVRQTLFSAYIDFDTYTGTITYNTSKDAMVSQVTLTNLRRMIYGTESGIDLDSLPSSVIGDILTIGGFSAAHPAWKISSIKSNTGGTVVVYLTYSKSGAEAPVTPTNGTFYIGMGAKGRIVYKSNLLPMDFRVTNIDIDCDVLKTKFGSDTKAVNPLTVRVYQEGNEAQADSLLVEYTDAAVSSGADATIRASKGPRNIIVDFYNPSDPDNTSHKNEAGFAGRITVYGTPASIEENNNYSTL